MQLFSYMICLDISKEVLTPICDCFCRSEPPQNTMPKLTIPSGETQLCIEHKSQPCLLPSSSLKTEWAEIRFHPPSKAAHDMIAIIKQYMKTENVKTPGRVSYNLFDLGHNKLPCILIFFFRPFHSSVKLVGEMQYVIATAVLSAQDHGSSTRHLLFLSKLPTPTLG